MKKAVRRQSMTKADQIFFNSNGRLPTVEENALGLFLKKSLFTRKKAVRRKR